MRDILGPFESFDKTKLHIFFLKYAFWIAQRKDSVMDKRKEAQHSLHSGQKQEYSFVPAFITEKMSLSLADSVVAARLYSGSPWKCSFRYNF